jgi:predicted NUDIX family phosphoesterase
MNNDEKVLVIPTEHLVRMGVFHGFRADDAAYRRGLLDPAFYEFRPRSEVETDPSFKQLIPYVLLKCGTELFRYRRAGGGEKRLQNLWSVGIGGHISLDDAAGGEDAYRTGMLRELSEEVEIGCQWNERFLGFINDDRTPVGSVHLGVVHLMELEAPVVVAREDALADAGFEAIAKVRNRKEEFETWSQFALESL